MIIYIDKAFVFLGVGQAIMYEDDVGGVEYAIRTVTNPPVAVATSPLVRGAGYNFLVSFIP